MPQYALIFVIFAIRTSRCKVCLLLCLNSKLFNLCSSDTFCIHLYFGILLVRNLYNARNKNMKYMENILQE